MPLSPMSSPYFPNPLTPASLTEDTAQAPHSFSDTIAQIKTLVLQEFDREVTQKQLCYHTREHIAGVQRRAREIFQAVSPYLNSSHDRSRLELLLDLCAIAHDLIQIFVPQMEPYTPRRREAGVSEAATIERLLVCIQGLSGATQSQNPDCSALFTDDEVRIIQEAIAATICHYDPTEQAIFQPALWSSELALSPVARILALADIGALGMEGIAAYNREGTLLFLEENPDVRSLVQYRKLESLTKDYPDLSENVRQRLLRRARFQVNFAKSRLNRLPHELAGFPPEAIPTLTKQVFQHLTSETIEAIETTTPIAENTLLEDLVTFFQLEQVVGEITPI